MLKKLAKIAIITCLTASMSITAFAATGGEATSPAGSGETGASTGAGTISKASGAADFTTDDGFDGEAADNTDINVWAKVTDKGTIVYKVDLAWGAMKFEYTSGNGVWNPDTHTYNGGAGQAEWTETGYLDGTNNKLDITNHSNGGIDAGLAFSLAGTPFNASSTSDNAVVGNFFATNANAVTASQKLTGTYSAGAVSAVTNSIDKVQLPTADNSGSSAAGTETKAEAYFAFSGTPDEGKGAELDNFKKVGVITVTIAPTPAQVP